VYFFPSRVKFPQAMLSAYSAPFNGGTFSDGGKTS
jgi:hypothetical protein